MQELVMARGAGCSFTVLLRLFLLELFLYQSGEEENEAKSKVGEGVITSMFVKRMEAFFHAIIT